VVAGVLAAGGGVAVGCAPGADHFVRQARPSAAVFAVDSGRFGHGRSAYAARSAALVQHVAAAGGSFAGFVCAACPPEVAPARSWSSGATVSGSWSSLALAAGLGCPVFVFWCASGQPRLPGWPGGSWAFAASGLFAGAWAWQSAQLALF
jgi:hypothetical protein